MFPPRGIEPESHGWAETGVPLSYKALILKWAKIKDNKSQDLK